MNYEQSNVGLGMVPHKRNCRCDECRIEKQQRRIRKLEALVESAYREGFIDGYDDDARPQDADSGWEHSEARRELEPPR